MGKSSPPQKRGLGRGLGALIVNTEQSTSVATAWDRFANGDPSAAGGVRFLAIDAIQPNPRQPRTQFDDSALAELAASIRTHGIIQPLLVTEQPAQSDLYWLIAGERRWRAARLAGLAEVPVLVREALPQALIELALVENVQRADLNALEEATAYRVLLDEFKLTHAQIAERVGKSRSAVTNTLRLLELPLTVQEALITLHISAGHARALVSLPDHAAMQRALQQVMQRALNVRQTEALVKQMLASQAEPSVDETPVASAASAHLAYLENRFRGVLGTRVQLNRNPNGSGRLVVHFYNDDDLAQLYKLIAKDSEGGE
ncbi:MAG: ParB/RepB/Spo0J family partition protein [Chloroflexota bacterium]|nr:ParB/RepB/Spo0J family partition protein [Chloroflexota bacterium]